MATASTGNTMSPQLLRVARRAKSESSAQFHALAHLIEVDALRRAYQRQRSEAAVGVDGVDKEQYGRDLESNLRDLHARLRSKRYRHQPIRRVHIPKERAGKTRPIGVSCLEDKVVQEAIREVLEAVYEQDFRDGSYGFRPGRRAHDAIRAVNGACYRGEVNWVLEADIEKFFDSVDRPTLKEMLKRRLSDGSLLRLIGKCLKAGMLDGDEFSRPDRGTTQGSVLSPILGNIYLHYVLDQWFEEEVKPRLQGATQLVRYADDFVLLFEREADARRVKKVLRKRMAKYGLNLSAEKTRLIPFGRPPREQGGKEPGSFEFLGFRLFWQKTRGGSWQVVCRTRPARKHHMLNTVSEWCRRTRHLPVAVQHEGLVRKLRGHFQYFGVNGNTDSLATVQWHARRTWYKWLRRRSQKTRLNWERYTALLRDYPLPVPRVYVSIWGPTA